MEIIDTLKFLTEHPEGTFLDVMKFNQHQFGAVSIQGVSPVWEMHPDTDEFFFILDGEVEITLAQADGNQHFVSPKNTAFVVPKGIWHKPAAPNGAKILYLTPGETLHTDREDPRG